MTIRPESWKLQSPRAATIWTRTWPYFKSTVMAPLLLLIAILVVWQVLPQWFHIPSFILPTFSDVVRALVDPSAVSIYLVNTWVTVIESLAGLALGTALGLVLGILLADIEILHRMAYPYIVALQSVPKVAIAPLFVLWFGFGAESKVFVVVLLTFFPVLVNTMSGIRGASQAQVDLFRALNASRTQIRWKLLIPGALPSIFAGFEMAVVLALLGAIVGEFVGAQRGLGVLILQAQYRLAVAAVYALLVILGILGVVANWSVRKLRRRLLFWLPGERSVGGLTTSAGDRARSR